MSTCVDEDGDLVEELVEAAAVAANAEDVAEVDGAAGKADADDGASEVGAGVAVVVESGVDLGVAVYDVEGASGTVLASF